MEKVWWLLLLASRIFFAAPGNVFFDSKEYLMRWAEPNLWTALTTGHTPLHAGYVLTFWPIYQMAARFTGVPEYMVILGQIAMSLGVVYFFYKISTLLFSKVIALKASVLLSLSPLFWITNGSVMMETTYLFYWIASVYFLLVYLNTKKGNKYLLLSGVLWMMAFMTHTVVILWIPLMLFMTWMTDRNKFTMVARTGMVFFILIATVNAILLSRGQGMAAGFYELFLAKFGEHAKATLDLTTLLRYFRNWIVPTFYNNNGLLVLTAVAGLFGLIRQKGHEAILFLLWILPTLITNQWWDSLFFGRHALIAIFAIAILAAMAARKRIFWIVVLNMAVGTVPAMMALKQPTPYLSMKDGVESLLPGGLLIESHFARPQISGTYDGEIFFVGEPGYDLKNLPAAINGYHGNSKPVYVTGQALSEPYGLFNGPFLHSLTLSYKDSFLLRDKLKDYSFTRQYSEDAENNLIIYRMSGPPGEYPEVWILTESDRRLDRYDIISTTVLKAFTYSAGKGY